MNTKHHRLIFWTVYIAYTAIYIARINLSVASPELIDMNIVNEAQVGILGSVFSTVYAVGRLINGGLSDKNPPWLMLTVGVTVVGISNLCVSFLPPFIAIFLLWTTNAYAQSMLWSSVLCVVSSLYDGNEAKKKTSVMVSSVATGNLLAIIICTYFITKFGVAYAFIVPGMLTVLLGAMVFFATRKISIMPKLEKKHISMFGLLKKPEMKKMMVPAMMHGVMKENISLWMAVYVVDKYAVNLKESAYYVLLIPVIGFIGRTIYPAVYKFCGEKENRVSMVGFTICIISALVICIEGVNMLTAVICLSMIYAAASMINTSTTSIYPLHYSKSGNVASVSGILDFGTYLGGGIASAIYGIVIASYGYLPMFVSWVIISVISIGMLVWINKCRIKAMS